MGLERTDTGKLIEGFQKVCRQASVMRRRHSARASKFEKKHNLHSGLIVVLNVLTAGLLAFSEAEVAIVASALAMLSAICTGFLLAFDYKGKAGRHSELGTCYRALDLGCQAEIERFHAGRTNVDQFDTLLVCNVGTLKELVLRSNGLDSSCGAPTDESSGGEDAK